MSSQQSSIFPNWKLADLVQLQPNDIHNQVLRANVSPSDWVNPVPSRPYHLVVIGAGTAGLVTAAGAAGLGARVALIERELMGGDCLNVGCVPSKGIIRVARIAATVRDAEPYGVNVPKGSTVNFAKAMERMRSLRAQISPNDSAKRFASLGIDVFFGKGSFVNSHTATVIRADGSSTELKFKKAVIATGARASAPPIPGLQTTNPRIYAAGDICSKYKFKHAADFQARIVIQNALFAIGPFGKRRASDLVVPWATYTSPEIAHVGLYERAAKEAGIEIDTYIQPFSHIDRAILEGQDDGFVKVHTKKGTDKIVGATIVAENAGDLISEITLAMTSGLGLGKIGGAIHPYPTQAEAIRKLGDQFSRTKLTPFSKTLLGMLQRWNVGS